MLPVILLNHTLSLGIIDNAEDSIFTYPVGQNWSTYHFPDFEPVFEITFTDLALQQAADEVCGDDFCCRYDSATTRNTAIGLSTLMGIRGYQEIIDNSLPSEPSKIYIK